MISIFSFPKYQRILQCIVRTMIVLNYLHRIISALYANISTFTWVTSHNNCNFINSWNIISACVLSMGHFVCFNDNGVVVVLQSVRNSLKQSYELVMVLQKRLQNGHNFSFLHLLYMVVYAACMSLLLLIAHKVNL